MERRAAAQVHLTLEPSDPLEFWRFGPSPGQCWGRGWTFYAFGMQSDDDLPPALHGGGPVNKAVVVRI
jgi:hypothetical protein